MHKEIPFSARYCNNMKILYGLVSIAAFLLLGLGLAGGVVAFRSEQALRYFLLANCAVLLLFSVWCEFYVHRGLRGLAEKLPAMVLEEHAFGLHPMINQHYCTIPWRDIAAIELEGDRLRVTPTATGSIEIPKRIPVLLRPFYRGKTITIPNLTKLSDEDLCDTLNRAKRGDFALAVPRIWVFPNLYYLRMNFRYNLALLATLPVMIGGIAFGKQIGMLLLGICVAIVFALRVWIVWVDQHAPCELKLSPDTLAIQTVEKRTRHRRYYRWQSLPISNIAAVRYLINGLEIDLANGEQVALEHLQLSPEEWRQLQDRLY